MSSTTVIAEIGINMNQSLLRGFALIDEAINCGADVIKTQLEVDSQYTLNAQEILKLSQYCEGRIPFSVTAFDVPSLEFLLTNVPMPLIKIPSGNVHPDILLIASRAGLPLIVSTGAMNINDIKQRINPLRHNQITLLHCVSAYPTPLEAVNLRAMATIKQQFGWCKIGLSDHSGYATVPVAAVAMGAEVIEVHFTLDRNLVGPDHRSSLEPGHFRKMVKCIREVETALGSPVKEKQAIEQ